MPKSSYCAHPLMKVKKRRFQGHALCIDKIFLSKDDLSALDSDQSEKR